MFQTKKQILLDFIEKHKNLPKQGSAEWLDNRQFTIGGSEMATITGDNPFGGIKDLVKTKLGWKSFVGSAATDWGKVFEPCAQILLETLFKCNIYETGSLPGCIDHTSYSPDGFATVTVDAIRELYSKNLIRDHEIPGNGMCSNIASDINKSSGLNLPAVNVVFEIKSPYKRIPKPEVPNYYMPQPLSALSHFDMLDIAYFADVLFRTCKLNDFNNLNYNKYLSSDSYYTFNEVLFKSMIGFAADSNKISWTKSHDLGLLTQRELESLFNLVVKEKVQAFYFDINATHKECVANLNDICEKNDLVMIGLLPYKIYKLCLTPIYKIPNYVQQFQPEIENVFSTINQIKSADDQKKKFNEIFEIEEDYGGEDHVFVD